MMLAGVLTTVVLLFFLLVSGDLLLRRFVEILPTLRNKKQAGQISNEIESRVSSYLFTITLMNAGVGLATGIATYLCGLSDPILWGSVAFLLNYIPILGPLSGVAILFLAGLLSFDTICQALLPAGLYLAFHIIEGEYVTPMLLARRFTLNPVLVIICLGVLVLDVAYRWSDPGGTHACHAENHLRPHSAADGVGPFYWR